MKISIKLFLFSVLLTITVVFCKLLFASKLAWSGFSPIIAIALFAGMIVNDRKMSFFLPLIALFTSDIIIQIFFRLGIFPFEGFYHHQFVNYGLLLLATLIGRLFNHRKYSSLLISSLIAPTIFFLLSNLSVWISSSTSQLFYSKSLHGLIECYIAGIPFYKNSLLATLSFLPLIMIAYNYMIKNKEVFIGRIKQRIHFN